MDPGQDGSLGRASSFGLRGRGFESASSPGSDTG